ncbi:MAG: AAA family ATPase [Acidimicrobiales bacterium]
MSSIEPVQSTDAEGAVTSEIHVPPPPPKKTRLSPHNFDRFKLLFILGFIFVYYVWRQRSDVPVMTLRDAVVTQFEDRTWLLWLFGIESLRQFHYWVSEKLAWYNHFWQETYFGGIDRWKDRRNPWLRFRMGRYMKWAFVYFILSLFVVRSRGVGLGEALTQVPSALWSWFTTGPETLPFWISILFPLFFIVGQFGLLFWFLSRGGVDTYFPADIETSFDDVWGQDHVVDKVRENIVYLEDPRSIEEKGGHVPGGLLLWGPPGTGKTLMAEAVAGQTGKPYVFVDPGAFINMFMGVGILKVKGLFRKLRKLSLRYGGVIVFFDEADALGNRGSLAGTPPGQGGFGFEQHDHLRWLSPESQIEVFRSAMQSSGVDDRSTAAGLGGRIRDRIIMGGMGGGGGGMGTLQALLTEISGLKKPRGFLNRTGRRFFGLKPKPPPKYRILIMMATNLPTALDEALLRPGRIDRIYKVGYPSKEGRRRTYEGYLDRVRHNLTDEQVDKLSVITPYATGASIKDLVNESLINAIRAGRDTVTWADVIHAKHFKELGPSEDVEYIERERHAISIHEACHAVAALRVRHHMNIDIATIEKGGTYLGMVSSVKPEDQFTRWRSEYEADIIVSLASLAGERLFFDGDNSSGVSGDLESATTIAGLMEGFWGMGSTVASHSASKRLEIGGGGGPKPGGGDEKEVDPTAGPLGQRVEGNLARLLDQAEELLKENYYEVLALSHALETHKTLAGEDVVAIVDGEQGPLIDGRPYKTDEVRRELVSYHELAAAAHRAHSQVAKPLPALAVLEPAANDSTDAPMPGEAQVAGADVSEADD